MTLFFIKINDNIIIAQTNENNILINKTYNSIENKVFDVVSSNTSIIELSPKIIQETIITDIESDTAAIGFGRKLDWIHLKIYRNAQSIIEKFDYCFKPPKGEKQIVKLSRFRVGLFNEAVIKNNERFENLNTPIDFNAEIELPNMKRRMKLIIATLDPTKLPVKDITKQQDKALRTAASIQLVPHISNISTNIGIKMRWQPELFTNLVWKNTWKRKNWTFYPEQKFYWESKSGFGEISTLIIDHWINRWNMRFSMSVKWSELDFNNDQYIKRSDKGLRWSEVFIFGYATELLDETQIGRLVGGNDIARGWGISFSQFGGFNFVDDYQAGVFFRCPLRKKWMYLFVGSDLNWIKANNWYSVWTIKSGVEILFWGSNER